MAFVRDPALLALVLALLQFPISGARAATHITNLSPPAFHSDSLAISGDTLVIGSELESNRMAADVYVRRDGVWRYQARLRPADGQETFSDAAVAVDGDTVILGVWGADDDHGAAYVFTRTGGTWEQQAKLSVEVDANLQFLGFGSAVALDGDVAVVNTLIRDDLAYVFRRDRGRWQLEATLQPGEGPPNFREGQVAIDEDTAVLGSPGEGAVYVFRRAGTSWALEAKLQAADGEPGDFFGDAVDVSGDRVIVGAHQDDNPGEDSQASEYAGRNTGAAYVFVREPGGWRQEAKLLPRDRVANDVFGWSVALDDDTALISAISTRDEGYGAGSVYVYGRYGDDWIFQSKLVASDQNQFSFGWSVALDGDHAAVNPSSFGDEPAAYVFSLQPRPFLRCLDDLDGDTRPDLAMIMPDGTTSVRRMDSTLINAFSFDGLQDMVDVAVLPDTDSNQAPELAALDRASATVQLRDTLSGGALATSRLAPYLTPLEVDVASGGLTGGAPLVASFAWRPVTAQIANALTGARVGDVEFLSPFFTPRSLLILPDLDGNGSPEGAVLAENKSSLGSDKVEIRDVSSGALIDSIWFGNECDGGPAFCRTFSSHQQVVVADLDGNQVVEVGVLRLGGRAPRNFDARVTLRDASTGRPVGRIPFDPNYPPQRLLALPDANGNGADELLGFARRAGFGNQRVMITDSRTGRLLNSMFFDKTAPMQDLTTCPDMNGNGAAEVALLGRRLHDDRLKAIVKDGLTGERLAVVKFF